MQTDRATRHGVLRFAQERSTDNVPASLPSFANADHRLDRCEVRCRRSPDPTWRHQRLHPHLHVHLLHAVRVRAAHAEVSLVEKIPDQHAARSVYHNIFPQFPNAIHQLQLPQAVVVPTHDQRPSVHLHVWIILC